MLAQDVAASLIVTVDVDWSTDPGRLQTLEQTALGVLERLNAAQLVATWGLTDVAHPLGELIVDHASHEVAIHAGPTLVGTQRTRAEFARDMALQLKRARTQGRGLSSILLADGCRVGHVDLLLKLGISAVRGGPVRGFAVTLWQQLLARGRRGALDARPRWLRWGVRELPSAMCLLGNSLSATRGIVDRAVAEQGFAHISIDAGQLAAAPTRGWAILDAWLKHVVRHRDAGYLRSFCCDQIVAQLAPSTTARPSRSILERRAA